MLLPKIICVVFLSKYVIQSPSKSFVAAQTNQNLGEEVNVTEDLILRNYSENAVLHRLVEGHKSEKGIMKTPKYSLDDGHQHLHSNLSMNCLTSNITNDQMLNKKYKGDENNEIKFKDRLHDVMTPMDVTKDESTVKYATKIKKVETKETIANITTFMEIVNLIFEKIKPLKFMEEIVPTDSCDTNQSTSLNSSMRLKALENEMDSNGYILKLSSKHRAKKTQNNIRRKRSPKECEDEITFGNLFKKRPYYSHAHNLNDSGDLLNSCYVCGMDDRDIPNSDVCDMAFRPLSTNERQLYAQRKREFRKQCRRRPGENNYCVKHDDPHSVFGPFTGGCATRTTDISGVYTQRTCRNREHPTLGFSHSSHRMAKLELTLHNVDDGCVVSPSASLLPFSHSVSLFARFQVCVCSGNWCNTGASKFSPSCLTSLASFTIPLLTKSFIYL